MGFSFLHLVPRDLPCLQIGELLRFGQNHIDWQYEGQFGPLNLLKQLNVHVIIVGLLFLYICVVLAAELVFKAL